MLTTKELRTAFKEGVITEEKFKEELFKLETSSPKKRKQKKLPTFLTQDEFAKLIDKTTKYKFKTAFLLAFGSGMRLSEIVGGIREDGENIEPLTKEKVDLKEKKMFIADAKGGKQRVVPLPKGFKLKMLNYLPLNKTYKNTSSARRSIQRAFKETARAAGLLETKPSLHFHSLRHSFGTRLANQGVPIHQIAILMGHSNISTTNVYTIADPVDALKAYEDNF